MRLLLLTLITLLSIGAESQIRVAILDTGIIGFKGAKFCSTNEVDFTDGGAYPTHGTNVAKIIHKYAGSADYCFTAVKWYPAVNTLHTLRESLKYAISHNFHIVVIAGGGTVPDAEEERLIQKLLDKNTIVIVAAGNEQANLDDKCNYYPACYDPRLLVASAKIPEANKGKAVDFYSIGSYKGERGSSWATAAVAGMIIKKLDLHIKALKVISEKYLDKNNTDFH